MGGRLTVSELSGDITKQYSFRLHQHQAADRRTTERLIKILLGAASQHTYEILPQSLNRYQNRLWCRGQKDLLRSKRTQTPPCGVNAYAQRGILSEDWFI